MSIQPGGTPGKTEGVVVTAVTGANAAEEEEEEASKGMADVTGVNGATVVGAADVAVKTGAGGGAAVAAETLSGGTNFTGTFNGESAFAGGTNTCDMTRVTVESLSLGNLSFLAVETNSVMVG